MSDQTYKKALLVKATSFKSNDTLKSVLIPKGATILVRYNPSQGRYDATTSVITTPVGDVIGDRTARGIRHDKIDINPQFFTYELPRFGEK